jgi:hypothetical protein
MPPEDWFWNPPASKSPEPAGSPSTTASQQRCSPGRWGRLRSTVKRQAEPNAHLWGMQAKRADPTSRECKSHDERVTCVSSR